MYFCAGHDVIALRAGVTLPVSFFRFLSRHRGYTRRLPSFPHAMPLAHRPGSYSDVRYFSPAIINCAPASRLAQHGALTRYALRYRAPKEADVTMPFRQWACLLDAEAGAPRYCLAFAVVYAGQCKCRHAFPFSTRRRRISRCSTAQESRARPATARRAIPTGLD